MRKKGTSETDYTGLFMLEVIVLIILIFVLGKAIGALFAPDAQTAVLNTERLRAKINEACFNEGHPVTLEGFRLTQPKPNKLYGATDILPRLAISSGGDPNFVLYYEAFPIGEAVGWEVYQDLGTRVIAPYEASGDTIQSEQFKQGIETHIENVYNDLKQNRYDGEFSSKNPETIASSQNIMVNNIILNNNIGAIPSGYYEAPAGVSVGESPSSVESFYDPAETDATDVPTYSPVDLTKNPLGEWYKDSERDDQFVFKNYRTLTNLEKSFIKYRPCGDNSLCLKTRDYVYKFPLDVSCKDADYIQLVYDARDVDLEKILPAAGLTGAKAGFSALLTRIPGWIRFIVGGATGPIGWGLTIATFGTTAFQAGPELVGFSLRYKVSDFYLASPCSFESLEITKLDTCSVPGQNAGGNNKYFCKTMIKYPIYSYGANIENVGDHYTCIDSLGDDFDVKDSVQSETPSGGCIRITAKVKAGDFCFTRNPQVTHVYEGDWIPDWMQAIKDFITQDGLTQILQGMGGLPVKDTTSVFVVSESESVLIKPDSTASSILSLNKNAFEKAWSWAWP